MSKNRLAIQEMNSKEAEREVKQSLATQEALNELAEHMVRRYVQDLLSVGELIKQLQGAWQENIPEDTPGGATLETLARGLCSQALCEACQLPEGRQRDLAFEHLNTYLERALGDIGGTIRYAPHEVRAEIIQETLLEILKSLQRERGKPEQPLAFLGWVRVILQRQVTRYWRQQPRVELLSLEGPDQSQLEKLSDEHTLDPLLAMLQSEKSAELHVAIASLRNSNYRTVLLHLYLHELEACEVAELMQVPINDIYLWHHRALHALHKQLTGGRKSRPVRCQ